MNRPLLALTIAAEGDVVAARQRARRVADLAGFDLQDQTRIATAVSEIARNAYEYAGGGRVTFAVAEEGGAPALVIEVADRGPGIADPAAVLEGRARSRTGMGVGLPGSRSLVDRLTVETAPGQGTQVRLVKRLPRRRAPPSPDAWDAVAARLQAERASDPLAALAEQNRELVASLDEIRRRQEELAALNRELQDTNRGVVALYAELDQRAEQLASANEAKTRFLSNVSHEFRTPLNSILALAGLLLDRVDGPLLHEQERQVEYVRRSAQELSDLVNDLLDLAKVEAGRADLRVASFTLADLFAGLRGALRVLPRRAGVALVFEEPGAVELRTDEAKLAQVLRNLVSNALKFTEAGEVRVGAREEGGQVVFAVADTGIGIAAADQGAIFEEFTQVDHPLQRAAKGTGLGLPLSRRLAELLGGALTLASEPGRGSTFTVSIPRLHPGAGATPTAAEGEGAAPAVDGGGPFG